VGVQFDAVTWPHGQDIAPATLHARLKTTENASWTSDQPSGEHMLSSYDASCLELALREGLPLATLDADLRNSMLRAGGAEA
jgi:predicted nucleic acid-binding protein